MATIFTCDQAGLVNDAAQYRLSTINAHERKALFAYAKLLQLSAQGTDYSANFPQLFIDAAHAVLGIDKDALEAAHLNMEFLKAENNASAGFNAVTVPSTLDAKLLAARPLLNQPDDVLDRIILFLDCSLNAVFFNT